MMDDLSGKTIRGYDLRQRIGAGGFGTVYLAHQPVVQRDVAIKIILPERASRPEFIRRFEAEAQFVARLEHIHIVPLYDYWRDPDGAYLVMRWLRGGSLQDSLRRGPWNLPEIARLVDQIAAALTVAHRNGVIHRDLKPVNILLDEEGNAFLSDFGIAKDIFKNPDVSPEDGFFGSPAYVSPEQILGDPVSPRSDIYSLGIVLFEMLTGQVPFDAPTDSQILHQHVHQTLPNLNAVRPDLPAALDMVVRRATGKLPHTRYTDALKLAEDFHTIVAANEKLAAATSHSLPRADSVMTRQLGAKQADVDEADTRQLEREAPAALLEPRNPFKGLRPFEETDAADFFGRDQLIRRIIAGFVDGQMSARFTAVVGPSGSGKSSVVKAGLIPALRQGAIPGSTTWFFLQMTPGTSPLHELEEALSRVAVTSVANLASEMLQNAHTLSNMTTQILPDGCELLLVIDQFEELFTLTPSESERACLLENLIQAVSNSDSRFRLIITLRADFYDRPLLYPAFGELVRQHTEVILPLSSDELRDAITAPASRSGLHVEPQLVEAIVADVREQPGALPLLQYALTELFERRDSHTLSLDSYKRIGGISGALARRAEDLYQSLDANRREAVRQFFLRLVTPGQGSEDTRRRVLLPELETIAHYQEVLQLFSGHRLLTIDRDPATRIPTVDLAHEALIREWKLLYQWVDASRQALQLQRRLSQETSEWVAEGRAPGFLATGARLAQFEVLLDEATLVLNEDERAYLDASIGLRRRGEARLRLFLAVLAVFSVIALAFALLAFDRQQRADAERIRADHEAALSRSRELAVTALNMRGQLDLSLLLSIEALRVADTFEARNSLLSGLESQPNLISILRSQSAEVRAVAVDPQGRWLASGGSDATIMLWDLATHQQVARPLIGHTGAVNSLAFSPDGRLLASGSNDHTIRLWNPETGETVGQPLEGHTDAVWTVTFNPEGTLLASGGADQTIRLWDTKSGNPVGDPLMGHNDIVFALAFDPLDRYLASAGDETVRLWDVSAGTEIGEPFSGHNDWVLSLAFSPDGALLASGSADNTIRLWNMQSLAASGEPLIDHSGWIRSLRFSPDGQLLASGGGDGTVHLYDLRNGQLSVLSGHQDEVWSVAFTPDGNTIVSGSEDHTLRLWTVEANAGLGQWVAHQGQTVSGLALSSDGLWLASASGDPQPGEHTIHLWNTATAHEAMTFVGHQQAITGIAFSPNGQLIASGSADNTVRLWNAGTGQPESDPLLGHEGAVTGVAFSFDGKLLASASQDHTIRIWDVAARTPLGDPLTGHSSWVTSVAFDPIGNILASGSADTTIILWDVETRTPIGEPLTGHTDEITRLAFSADGTQLASASRDGTVRIWDVATRQPIGQPFVGHQNWVLDVAFKPDEPILATSSRDQTLILWDLNTGQPVGQPLTGWGGWITRVVFSADGRFVWSGDQDGNIVRWPTSVDIWRDHACRIANRNLTLQEWQRYLHEESYQKTCPELSPL